LHFARTLHYAIGVLDDERVRAFFRATVVGRLEQTDLSPLAGRLLDALTDDGRHRQLLDRVLLQLARVLEDDTVKAEVAEVVAAEVRVLRLVGLDHVAGRYAAGKMVNGVVRLVGEMAVDPLHPLRVRFDHFLDESIVRLQSDPELRVRGEAIKQELLAHPALSDYLHGLWSEMIDWLQSDLAADDSTLRGQVALGTRSLGEKLGADAAMQAWINEQVRAAAPRWIDRYREDIRRYIVARVGDWNAAEMTDELERNIGRDLQFIRINGTLVGGLVGLAIHSATELAHRFL
jgi:uncharacterized membrane-anchored protein YjiN (DUF445 family)